jgi:hypothetical protein
MINNENTIEISKSNNIVFEEKGFEEFSIITEQMIIEMSKITPQGRLSDNSLLDKFCKN